MSDFRLTGRPLPSKGVMRGRRERLTARHKLANPAYDAVERVAAAVRSGKNELSWRDQKLLCVTDVSEFLLIQEPSLGRMRKLFKVSSNKELFNKKFYGKALGHWQFDHVIPISAALGREGDFLRRVRSVWNLEAVTWKENPRRRRVPPDPRQLELGLAMGKGNE